MLESSWLPVRSQTSAAHKHGYRHKAYEGKDEHGKGGIAQKSHSGLLSGRSCNLRA
jgi:hypothetical protein